MSWRAPPSQPLPAITSTASPYFGTQSAPSRSSNSRSSSASSSSAVSHLTRQLAEMDDDTRSVRSQRSVATLTGASSNGRRNGWNRSRSASSIGGRTIVQQEPLTQGSDIEMELEPSPSILGHPSESSRIALAAMERSQVTEQDPAKDEPLARPESVEGGGTVPQVVKRARKEVLSTTASIVVERRSWFGSITRRASLSSGQDLASLPLPDPPSSSNISPTRSSSSGTERSDPSESSIPSNPLPASLRAQSDPVLALSPPRSTPTPTERSQPSSVPSGSSTVTRRTSWFSLSTIPLRTEPPSSTPSRLREEITTVIAGECESTVSQESPRFLDVPGLSEQREDEAEREREKGREALRERERGREKETERQRASLGWLGYLWAPPVIESAKVSAAVRTSEAQMESTEIPTSIQSAPIPKVAGATLSSQTVSSATLSDPTPPPPPAPRTQQETKSSTPIPPQQGSWWSRPTLPPPTQHPVVVPSPPAPPAPTPTPIEVPIPQPEEASVSSASSSHSDTARVPSAPSWRNAFWGELPNRDPPPPSLKTRQEDEQRLASQTASLSITPTAVDVPESTSTSPATTAEIASNSKASIHTLKHKSSWANFFPSRTISPLTESDPTRPHSTATPAPPSPSTSVGTSTPVPVASQNGERGRGGPKASLLGRSPLVSAAGPIGNSSSASSHSRASSRSRAFNDGASSAPNSPRLTPQQDSGPVKPLTGSIRSSSRQAFNASTASLRDSEELVDNLVLPTFKDTFQRAPRSFPPKKGKLNRAVSVVSSYLFSAPPANILGPNVGGKVLEMTLSKPDPAERLPKSLEIMGYPPRLDKIARVVTIGVHGWFPNPMLKSVFGEPTGTSVKFATMMHDAVQSYLESKDITAFNIQAIALEGEGQVLDRVNRLYNQLVEREAWVHALKKADAVFLATHSQGSVVSIHLLARMVKEGLVSGSKIHLLAMCAISQGPFVYLSQSIALQPYFNYLESAAARELFEFQDPESLVSKQLLESLHYILAEGVKMTVVGSINDQVVPLYSALFSGIDHPSILRAVYIDSAAFRTSDFLANLVVFAARLRNAGLQDHDLTYHVSEALAGALNGVGHSKIYEEDEVFKLAVRYQLETTTMLEAPCLLHSQTVPATLSMSFNPRDRRNPYLLTWSTRGIIEDPLVRELFASELTALREAFETWRPTTKILKDVKMKLEGIRMLPRGQGKL